MKLAEKLLARKLRQQGYSLNEIAAKLGVAKSSVSTWVRDIELTPQQKNRLNSKGFHVNAIEKRRISRLANEERKRQAVILGAQHSVPKISREQLWLIGVMLYWAEGGKTQRMVRFSNGDPEMIKIMMAFFRQVCGTDEKKFRGYIHIHPHLNHKNAEKYSRFLVFR